MVLRSRFVRELRIGEISTRENRRYVKIMRLRDWRDDPSAARDHRRHNRHCGDYGALKSCLSAASRRHVTNHWLYPASACVKDTLDLLYMMDLADTGSSSFKRYL